MNQKPFLWIAVILLLFPLAAAGFEFQDSQITFDHKDYSTTLTSQGMLKDLLINETDLLGEDHHDGYDGLYISSDADPATGPINFENYTNTSNTITFNCSYANLTYTFDNQIRINLSVKNQSLLRLFSALNTETIDRVNETGTSNSQIVSDYEGNDENWENITAISKDNITLSFSIGNTTSSATTSVFKFYDNVPFWAVDQNDNDFGFPFEMDNNYTILLDINSSNKKPEPEYELNMTGSGGDYDVNTSLYDLTFENGILKDFFFNGSTYDLFGIDSQSDFNGLYLSSSEPDSGVITFDSSTVHDNRLTFTETDVNLTYSFFKDHIDITVETGDILLTKLYLAPNKDGNYDIFNKAYFYRDKTRSMDLPSEADTKDWEDIGFETKEKGELRFYLKRDHELGSAGAEFNYYDDKNLIYAVDLIDSNGFPMESNNHFNYRLEMNLSDFTPQQSFANITFEDNGFFIEAKADEYTAKMTPDGILYDLRFKNSTLDLLGEDTKDRFYGIYLTSNEPDASSQLYQASEYEILSDSVSFGGTDPYWKYTFYEDKIEMSITPNNEYPRAYFTPKMSSMKRLNETYTTNSILLDNETGDYAWPEVTYTTAENTFVSMFLNGHPYSNDLGTEGTSIFRNGVQLWGLTDLGPDGDPMEPGYTYKITYNLDINDKSFVKQPPDITIDKVTNYYKVTADNYDGYLDENCSMTGLRFRNSFFDLIEGVDYKGVYFTDAESNEIAVDNISISDNKLQCNTTAINWEYAFYEDKVHIKAFPKNEQFPRFYMTPNMNHLSKVYRATNESESMNKSDFSDKNWEKSTFVSHEGAEIYTYIARDHPYIFATPKIKYTDEQIIFSTDDDPLLNESFYNIFMEFDLDNYTPQNFQEITYTRTLDNKQTRAIIDKPDNADSVGKMPLIVALHPFNMSVDDFVNSIDLDEKAAANNWSFIAPESYGIRSDPDNHTKMDVAKDRLYQDLDDAIQEMESYYDIDTDKIYLATFENTGLITGAVNNDFAAIAAYWPVTNLTRYAQQSQKQALVETELGCNISECPFEYQRYSPITYAPNYNHPVKLYYDDTVVNKSHAMDFNETTTNSETMTGISTLSEVNSTLLIDWFDQYKKPAVPESFDYILDRDYKTYYLDLLLATNNTIGYDANDTRNDFAEVSVTNDGSLDITADNITTIDIDLEQAGLIENNITFELTGDRMIETTFGTKRLYSKAAKVNFSSGYPVSVDSDEWELQMTGNRPYFWKGNGSVKEAVWSDEEYNFTINESGDVNITGLDYFENEWVVFRDSVLNHTADTDSVVVSATGNYSIRADDMPPIIEFKPPTPENESNRTTSYFEVNATVNEEVGYCYLNVEGVNYVIEQQGDHYYANQTGNLEDDANHTYYIECKDNSDNIGYSPTRQIYLNWNRQPNPITLLYPDGDHINHTTIDLNWSATDPDGDDLNFTLHINDTDTDTQETFHLLEENYTTTLAQGAYEYWVVSNDSELSRTSSKNSFFIDTEKPWLNVTHPLDDTKYDLDSFKLDYETGEELSECNYSLNRNNYTSCDTQISAPQGWNNLKVNITDLAGNKNTSTLQFYVDTLKPDITLHSPKDEHLSNSSQVRFDYNVTDNSTLENCSLLVDYTVNETTSVNQGRNNFTQTFLDGYYSWQVRCIDELNNTRETTARILQVDTTDPNVTIHYPENTSYSPRNMSLDLSFTETVDNCTFTFNDVLQESCDANFSGVEGLNNISLWFNDTAGNDNSEFTQFRINSTAPEIYFQEPPTPLDGSTIARDWFEVNATFSENVSLCKLQIYNTTYSQNLTMTRVTNSICHINVTGLDDNTTYNYTLLANDTIGNINISTPRSLKADWNNPPTSPNLHEPAGGEYLNRTRILLNWSKSFDSDLDKLNYTVKVKSDNHSESHLTSDTNYTITLTENNLYNWTVLVNDSKLTNQSGVRNFTLDTVKPSITIIEPNLTDYNYTPIRLNWTTDETVNCTYNVSNGSDSLAGTCSEWIGAVQSTNNLTVTLTDLAGNDISSSVQYYVDSKKPNITLTSYPHNNSRLKERNYTIEYTVKDTNLSVCSLYLNNTLNESYNASRDNNFSFDINNTNITWEIRCNDTYHHNSTTGVYTLTSDDTPPEFNITGLRNMSKYNRTDINYTVNSTAADLDTCWFELNGNINRSGCGNISLQNITQGENNLTVFINDSINNIDSKSYTLLVDSINPELQLLNYNTTVLSNTTNHTILFNASDAHTINCSLHLNGTVNQTKTDPNNFTININNTKIGWYVNCTDTYQNTNTTANHTLDVDTRKPNITIQEPDKEYYNYTDIFLNFTSDKINTTLITTETGSYELDRTTNTVPSPEGNNTVTVWINDSYGNAAERSVEYIVDTVPPSIENLDDQERYPTNSTVPFEFNLHDASRTTCGINLSGDIYFLNLTGLSPSFIEDNYGISFGELEGIEDVNITNGSYHADVMLPDGNYTYNYTCVDFAGNRNVSSSKYLKIDLKKPTITLSEPDVDGRVDMQLGTPLEIEVRDFIVEEFNYNFDGKDYYRQPDSSKDEAVIDTTYLEQGGEYELSVTARDKNGNVAEKEYVIATETVDINATNVTYEGLYGLKNNYKNITLGYESVKPIVDADVEVLVNDTFEYNITDSDLDITNESLIINHNFTHVGDHGFIVRLFDEEGVVLPVEEMDGEPLLEEIYSSEKNSSVLVSSPTNNITLSFVWKNHTLYEVSRGHNELKLPDTSLEMHAKLNDSVLEIEAHDITSRNFVTTSLHVESIDITNLSDYNSSKFKDYKIIKSYLISGNDMDDGHVVRFNNSAISYSKKSNLKVFKAPYIGDDIRYENSRFIDMTQAEDGFSEAKVYSFSIFALVEEIVEEESAPSGGASGGGGDGGAAPSMPPVAEDDEENESTPETNETTGTDAENERKSFSLEDFLPKDLTALIPWKKRMLENAEQFIYSSSVVLVISLILAFVVTRTTLFMFAGKNLLEEKQKLLKKIELTEDLLSVYTGSDKRRVRVRLRLLKEKINFITENTSSADIKKIKFELKDIYNKVKW